MLGKLLIGISAAALCVACGSDEETQGAPGDGGVDSGIVQLDSGLPPSSGSDGSILTPGSDASLPPGTTGCGMVDLVFIVDDSASMVQEQESLGQNFPRIAAVLDALKGGTIDYRAAVTTTAVDFAIPFLQNPPPKGAFLPAEGVSRVYLQRGDADLAGKFSKLALVGTGGSTLEQPLEAVKRSLSVPGNADFFRKNALLAVVILTDEDDGGPSDPGEYVSALDAFKGARGNWAAAVIAGDKAGGCESSFGEAKEAELLKQFVSEAGSNAVMGSICSGDLASEIDKALNTFTKACETFIPLQ